MSFSATPLILADMNRLNDRLCIRVDPCKGRCVHAKKPFRKNQTIVVDPVIVLAVKDVEETVLNDYVLWWKGRNKVALGLGFSVLINHSKTSNVFFRFGIEEGLVAVVAKRAIAKGEELLVDYNIPLWFEAVSE